MSERNEHNDGNTQTAYFAGGCFWGLERYFQNVDGVTDTTVGYAQSTVESPAYEQVCAGGTAGLRLLTLFMIAASGMDLGSCAQAHPPL